MGQVNASTLIATTKSFRAIFMQSLMSVNPMWMRHAMNVPITTRVMDIQWLGRAPGMREWVDTKATDQLRGFDYSVRAKDWESTIDVDRNDIEDDALGLYGPAIQMLGMRARQHPDELLSTIRKAGSAALCYDGQFFYDTDHSEGESGTQANVFSGAGVTAANVRADYFAAKSKFVNFKDDKGKPFVLGVSDTNVVATIPSGLMAVFDELNNPAPGSTVPRTPIQYEVDPYLTDANDWYLDFIGFPVKPFLHIDRKPVNFVALDDPNATESVFMTKKFKYGVEGRYNMEYGFWQLSQKITNT